MGSLSGWQMFLVHDAFYVFHYNDSIIHDDTDR